MFFLAAVGHHYGLVASIRKQSRRATAIQSLERSIGELGRLLESSEFSAGGAQSRLHEGTLARYRSMVSYQKQAMLCSQVALLHEGYLRAALEFYAQTAQLLARAVGADVATLGEPLPPGAATAAFGALPQLLLDDMADCLLYAMARRPHALGCLSAVAALPDLASFILFVVTHASLVRSPYLVAKFVELLFSCLPSVNSAASLQPLFLALTSHYTVASGLLTNRLIQFYIDVEKTGASSEFYDKFSIRFKISIIFRSLWKLGSRMKVHLLTEAATRLDTFVKFVNRAMNDMVYLLDESISALKRIRAGQERQADAAGWARMGRQEQAGVLQQLAHDHRATKSQLTLADVTVEMLYDFTTEIRDPFLCPELVEKLAAMLNSFLLELVGPKCRDLKVHEPDKYHWNPKKLLQNITRIYLNLDSPALVEAISDEQRFYSNELFLSALSKLDNYNIISKHELEHFELFRQKVGTIFALALIL